MSWAAIAVGAVSIGTKIYTDAHAKSKAKKALDRAKVVDDSDVIRLQKEKRGNYQNAYNTGMLPGQAIRTEQIINNAGNAGSALQRNLTSGSQRAAAVGQMQGQLDASMQDYWGGVEQTKLGLLGGLTGTLGDEANEFIRLYDNNQKLRGALGQTIYDSEQNIGNSLGEIGGVAAGIGLDKLSNRVPKVKPPEEKADVPEGWKPDTGSAAMSQYGSSSYKPTWQRVWNPVKKKYEIIKK